MTHLNVARSGTALAIAAGLSWVFAGDALADFTFVKVADTNTEIPGGTGNFTSFGAPSLAAGRVAFRGIGSAQQGVYTNIGGPLTKTADLSTSVPGGEGIGHTSWLPAQRPSMGVMLNP